MFCVLIFVGLVTPIFAFDPLPAPENVQAVSNLDSNIELLWSAPTSEPEVEELAYDDGLPRGLDPGLHNDILSVRFTPANACSLKSIKLYMYSLTPPDTIELHIWRDDGYGYPLLFIGDIIEPQRFVVSASYEWITLDLSDEPIALPSEEFHIGIVKVDSSLHYILMDGEAVSPPRSFVYSLTAGEILPLSGDLMIRAYVTYETSKSALGKRVFRLPESHFPRVVEPLPLTDSFALSSALDVLSYRVYRSRTPDGPFYPLGETDSLHYTDYPLINNHTYYYKLTALYSEGESDFTPLVWATPRSGDGSVIDTLRYDDGSPSFAVSWHPGNSLATRFSTDVRKKLSGIAVFVYNPGSLKPKIFSLRDGIISDEPIFSLPAPVTANSAGWYYIDLNRFNIYLDGEFIVAIELMDASLSVGIDIIPGTSFSYDYNVASESWHNLADTLYFIKAEMCYDFSRVNIHLAAGWNQLSIPVVTEDNSFAELMPDIIPPAYRYDASLRRYVEAETFEVGEGYFVLAIRELSYTFTGLPARGFDKPVDAGWNMIGAPSCDEPYLTTYVVTFPDGLLLDPGFYNYDPVLHNYNHPSGLIPGKGYWILSAGEGTIRIEER